MVNGLTVSVIVPTYNRDIIPCRTIKNLLKQTYGIYEILVIDQNKCIADCLQEIVSNNHCVRHFTIKEKGLPNARNYGISKAKGEIIIFCDDDVLVPENFIENHIRNYEDRTLSGVAGRVLDDSPILRAKPKEIRQNRIAKIRWLDLYQYSNFNADVKTDAHHAQGCNMSYRKKIILELNGFDEKYGGTAHLEETDFCIRLKKAGHKMLFDPDAKLIHLKTETGGCRTPDWDKWFYWYGHNFALLYKKNTPIAGILIISKLLHIIFHAFKMKRFSVILCGMRGIKKGLEK